MPKTSIKGAARAALQEDRRSRGATIPDGTQTQGVTADSFQNFAHKLGVGADNALSAATYGFNPITRNRIILEWIHRGSWIGGVAVDVVAEDMVRQGIEYVTELPPDDASKIDRLATSLGVWGKIGETIQWGRLYGGAIGVMLIDGQDMRTPLNVDRVGPGQFRGILPLDRWMIESSTDDLVTELGPNLGMPKFYRVGPNAPALRGAAIHYSRVAIRHVGVRLPYNQSLTENLWGISVLERLYDRMIAYDSASTGAAQLVYKAYLRTLKIKGLRQVVASGGMPLEGLTRYTDLMRRFQSIEGITLVDGDDEFEAQVHGAFSGLSDILSTFASQLSGALQIPLTRLFGQSPGGLNANGDNDLRNYYDHIKQRQQADLQVGATAMYRCMALSEGIKLPPDFAIEFKSLWQLTATDKAAIAKQGTETILSGKDAGVVSDQVILQELRQLSRTTGFWSNITSELIDAADTELPDPMAEMMGAAGVNPETGEPFMPAAPTQGKQDGQQVRQKGTPKSVGAGKAGGGSVSKPSGLRRQTGREPH